ncbi:MAG: hypothetical protein ACTHMV_05970 [Chitinophagaceae bacterium]
MHNEESIQAVGIELGLMFREVDNELRFRQLADKINDLLVNDFDRLIAILYRMDVSDIKLKNLLKNNPGEDAGRIIAELMIERQAQKIESRKQFTRREDNIDENEKW